MKEPQIKRRAEEGKGEPGDRGEGKASRDFKLTIGQGSDGHLI